MAAVGDVLAEQFRLTAYIGAGPHGEVFEADQLGLERRVAVKIPFDEIDFSRVEREARASMRVSSAVRILACVRDHDPPFVVSELVRGPSLATLLGAVTPDRARRIARSVLVALEAAHAESVLHGDLRPSNIFLDGERARLGDFGFDEDDPDTARTRTLAIRATIGYRAPERIRGARADVRSDIFSMGVCLYALVSGEKPFGDALERVLGAAPKPLAPPLWPVIERPLAKNPEARFASAREMADALAPRRAKLAWILSAVAALLLVGAVLASKKHAPPSRLSDASHHVISLPSASESAEIPEPPPVASSVPTVLAAPYFDFRGEFSPDDQVGIGQHLGAYVACRQQFPKAVGRFAVTTAGGSKQTTQHAFFDATRSDPAPSMEFVHCLESGIRDTRLSGMGKQGRTFFIVFPTAAPVRPATHLACACDLPTSRYLPAGECARLESRVCQGLERCLLETPTYDRTLEAVISFPEKSLKGGLGNSNIRDVGLWGCLEANARRLQFGYETNQRTVVVHVR